MSRAAAVAAYGQAWRERDEDARLALLEQVWADDGVYCDPQVLLADREALARHIGAFQTSAPDWDIVITSEPLEHHDAAHFRWSIRDGSGADVIAGLDVAFFDDSGRITRLTGFFTG